MRLRYSGGVGLEEGLDEEGVRQREALLAQRKEDTRAGDVQGVNHEARGEDDRRREQERRREVLLLETSTPYSSHRMYL